ncbi:MAG: PSD1 and planctomycete cytochrome C domain-containing protein [Bryobacteraceae bacterium]|nr:PSD1 and planctomycete cytochrome C domain-containing protein [Bryobacteraceae bacterium]
MYRLALLAVLPAMAAVDYVTDVAPLLKKRCSGCHGAAQANSGFRVDSAPALLAGGYTGPVVIPGKSSGSSLIERVTSAKEGFQMPPMGARLTAAEVSLLREWIDAGAKHNETPAVSTAPKRAKHWAFEPLTRPVPPSASGVRNPIDNFVFARLAKEGVAPSPEASKATLLRRASLDLRGLPPTPQEVSEFLADARPDAYERMVDRFLASPHYGERFARPWLDLARYADSDGFEKDLVRPWAWRYRQWVIDALNQDLPFDRFTVEQIAGDLLPNATVEQRVATGFHRMTLYNREAGVSRQEDRFEQTINRANTIATTWMGLTAGCAQCHDHKYDPISQREYYQLFAFMDAAQHEDIDAPLPGELGPYLRAKPSYDKKRQDLLTEYNVPALQATFETQLIKAIRKPGDNLEWDFWVTSCTAMVERCQQLWLKPPAERTPREAEMLTDYFIANVGPDLPRDQAVLDKIKELRTKLSELKRTLPRFTQAYTMAADPRAEPTHIALKGDYKRPGLAVQPGTLAVLPPFNPGQEPPRLAFAKWLTSVENPLTPRVIANRAWQEFFGRGIVKTAEDFGTQGDRPTHPELLDWLAVELREGGWSLKHLHKTIVLSATYRQSSQTRPELKDRDPENTWLARQNRLRLPAELIRDAALAASGLLMSTIGGPSVMPPQPASVTALGYGSRKWEESQGPERYRRGLYIHFQRTTPYAQLMTFDAPDSNVACARRRPSNTALQSLNLLNDPVFFEAAQALAIRIDREAPPNQKLDYAFALALGRPAAPAERERLAKYLDLQANLVAKENSAATLLPAEPSLAPWVGLSRVLLNLDEFMTRE